MQHFGIDSVCFVTKRGTCSCRRGRGERNGFHDKVVVVTRILFIPAGYTCAGLSHAAMSNLAGVSPTGGRGVNWLSRRQNSVPLQKQWWWHSSRGLIGQETTGVRK